LIHLGKKKIKNSNTNNAYPNAAIEGQVTVITPKKIKVNGTTESNISISKYVM
jgi:hypothetical protein